ncbi:MAG: restriction endonuclease subunit S [Pseudomonadota bacterium]|nr:restriction endonuclease subunit S [Pseudomonadota bacterium]MDP1906149.1 restriction endonuclease subunit S [Pseudomonadota bacterium]
MTALVDLQAGHPFRGSVPEDPDGNAYALQMRDISPEGGVVWSGLVRTSLEKHKSAVWLQPGDIVFVARGMRNYALCLEEVPLPAVCSQYFFLLRVKAPNLLPEFLAWQINRAPARRYLASHAEGTDQLSIRRGVLEALPIVVPGLEQQQRIVALAKDAGRERQVLETLIHNREQQLDALAFELRAAHPLNR